jgi:hypothetical protein
MEPEVPEMRRVDNKLYLKTPCCRHHQQHGITSEEETSRPCEKCWKQVVFNPRDAGEYKKRSPFTQERKNYQKNDYTRK